MATMHFSVKTVLTVTQTNWLAISVYNNGTAQQLDSLLNMVRNFLDQNVSFYVQLKKLLPVLKIFGHDRTC